jgi:hypothetical protein
MRDIYLPAEARGTAPIVPKGTDLAVWKYDVKGVPYAIAFVGKQNKPFWHHRFRSDEERQRTIDQTASSRLHTLQEKQRRVDERKNFQHGLKKGDILVASWGYEQTNVDFYEITDVVGKSVILREIESKEAGHSHVVAIPGHFIGAPLRKIPQGTGNHLYVKISASTSAFPWDGKPRYVTPFGAGH